MSQWAEILDAISLALGGERAAGQDRLLTVWMSSDDKQHAERCVLAHYLADLESDLSAEISWDECALVEFAEVDNDALVAVGIAAAAAMAPSLHLNLGDGYLRAGRLAEARHQAQQGLACSGQLGDDGYGNLIRAGLDRLMAQVEGAGTS
ncbi:MAG: hypothetical protein Q7K25_04850 [Actinomycetota bacterium]|nr:hypothetical protein [Actinomycetota bacterium]